VASRAITATAARWLLVGLLGCGAPGRREEVRAVSSRPIEEVLAAHSDSLMAVPGVVGNAIGRCDGEPCIRVFFSDSTAVARAKLPARLEGYRVTVEVTGPIRPRNS